MKNLNTAQLFEIMHSYPERATRDEYMAARDEYESRPAQGTLESADTAERYAI